MKKKHPQIFTQRPNVPNPTIFEDSKLSQSFLTDRQCLNLPMPIVSLRNHRKNLGDPRVKQSTSSSIAAKKGLWVRVWFYI